MKKIITNIILWIAFMVFPIAIFAEGNITASPSSLTIEAGSTKTFTITATNTVGIVTLSSSNTNVATVSASEWETGAVGEGETKTGTITVTGVNTGTATITLHLNAATFDGEDLEGQARTVNVTVKRASSNNNLSSIKIDGTTISGFSSSVTDYTVNSDAASINLTATAEDSNARISGEGTKTLNYGNNRFELTVTAENGAQKKYSVTINRRDNRDTNNYLKSLSVKDNNIKFNKDTLTYTLEVEGTVEKATITAEAESTKARVTGDGEKTLKYGSNKFEIKVTAENETTKTYTITINRKDNRDTNNLLKSLSIKEAYLKFDKDTTNYTVEVSNEIEKINITAVAESTKAKVSGDGEKTLNVGGNTFEIKVTAENETTKIYKINITRKDVEQVEQPLINSLSIEGIGLDFDPNVYYYVIEIDDQDKLEFNYTLADGVTADITGNENLNENSTILLKLTKDGSTKQYTFNIRKGEKKEETVPSVTPTTGDKDNTGWLKKNWKWLIVVIVVLVLVLIGYIAQKKNKSKANVSPVEETPVEPAVAAPVESYTPLTNVTPIEDAPEVITIEESASVNNTVEQPQNDNIETMNF